MKQTILNLFNNSTLLDKDCLKNGGVKHIQHSCSINRNNIAWIDAAYIGTNGELYFMITDSNGEIKPILFESMYVSDIHKWYCSLTSKLNIQTAEKFTVIKHVGKNDKFVVREFNDEDDAKKFVDLLRKSEQSDFIKYSISQALNY